MSPVRVRQLSYTVILRSRSMSSKTAMRASPTTVMRRILCAARVRAGGGRAAGGLVVRRHGSGDHDGLHRVVLEDLLDGRGQAGRGIALREVGVLRGVDVAQPREVGKL